VNHLLIERLPPSQVEVVLPRVEEAEVDEMWSFVGKKQEPRWLWHALDHQTGKVLASVFGRPKDEVFPQLKALLTPFGMTRYYTDYWGASQRNLAPEVHRPGKHNTQQIERKHLTLRTRIKRLVRKTICFSKSIELPDMVIGLFINRYEFGLPVYSMKSSSVTPPRAVSENRGKKRYDGAPERGHGAGPIRCHTRLMLCHGAHKRRLQYQTVVSTPPFYGGAGAASRFGPPRDTITIAPRNTRSWMV